MSELGHVYGGGDGSPAFNAHDAPIGEGDPAARCDHVNTMLPRRPIPDWTGKCPDCGERITRHEGRLITVRENNKRAAIYRMDRAELREALSASEARVRELEVETQRLNELLEGKRVVPRTDWAFQMHRADAAQARADQLTAALRSLVDRIDPGGYVYVSPSELINLSSLLDSLPASPTSEGET
jgi:hypothetical protein